MEQDQASSSQVSESSSSLHEGLAEITSEDERRLLEESGSPKVFKAGAGGLPLVPPYKVGNLFPRWVSGRDKKVVETSRSALEDLSSKLETSVSISEANPLDVSDDNDHNATVIHNGERYRKTRRTPQNRGTQHDRPAGSSTPSTGAGVNKRKLQSPEDDAPAKKSTGGRRPAKQTNSYSEVAKKDLTVFIGGMKALTRGNTAEIRESICDSIDRIPSGEKKPQFEKFSAFDGMLVLTCADQFSKKWLEETIDNTTYGGGNALRHSIDRNDFALSKASVHISDSRNASAEKIFKRFQDQNQGLDTSQWTFFKELECKNPNVRYILFGIDWKSKEFITSRGRRLHYMLQHVKVDIRSNSSGSAAVGGRF